MLMSRLSKVLALLGLLAPLAAHGLGIGDIRAQSALNQALRADIPLVLSGSDRIDAIQVRLASPAAFEKAGVERIHALSELRFQPVALPNGRHAIQVSSRAAITEPFLDFLVEVASPLGTVLREFTLLLDPPRGLVGGPLADDTARPVPQRQPQGASLEPVTAADAITPPRYRVPDARTAAPASQRPVIGSDQLSGQRYGPVQRHEKLLDIANSLDRPASVSPEQMALGLYLANPRAFSRSLNSLRAGSILQIPSETALAQIDPADAAAMLFGGAPGMRQRAYAAPEDTGGVTARLPPSPPQAPDSAATTTGAVAEVSARIPAALKRENEELREQLVRLEQRLEETQRMLALKNAELTALQSHAATQVGVPPDGQDEPSLPDSQPPAAGTESSESAIAAAPPVMPQAPAIVAQPEPPAPSGNATKHTAPAPPPTPMAERPAEPEPVIAPGYWLASAGFTLLGLAAWRYRRRRRHADETGAEVAQALAEPMDRARPPAEAARPVATLDPAASGLDEPTAAAEAEPLDPVWEADVYLRYGRFVQAESLIRASLVQEPERLVLKLKLLDILQQAGKQQAFTDYVRELEAQQPGLPAEFWAAVRALNPGQPVGNDAAVAPDMTEATLESLDSQASAATDTDDSPATELDLDDTDFMAELRTLEAQLSAQPLQPQAEQAAPEPDIVEADRPAASDWQTTTAIPTLEAGLPKPGADDTGASRQETAHTEFPPIPQHQTEAADTTVDESLPAAADVSRNEQPPETAHPADSAYLIDFVAPDLEDWKTPAKTAEASAPEARTEPGNWIDYEVPTTGDPARTSAAETAPPAGLVELDFNTLPARPRPDNPRFGMLDFELEFLEDIAGTGTGTAASSLDRARALMARGDKGAARRLLQTVLQDGTPADKAAAETLLDELHRVRLTLVPPPPQDTPAPDSAGTRPKARPAI